MVEVDLPEVAVGAPGEVFGELVEEEVVVVAVVVGLGVTLFCAAGEVVVAVVVGG